MTAVNENPTSATPLWELVNGWVTDHQLRLTGQQRDSLVERLTAREDTIADLLRINGAAFGVYSEIVSEVLVTVGLGAAPDPQTRAFIHQQFHDLMTRLQAEQGGTTT